MTALLALPAFLIALYLGFKWGQRKAYANADAVLALVAQGELVLNEDGLIRQADPPRVEEQREVAAWQ